ncbi:hypothetical protein A2Z67_02330 [Candidatus Woesebacteria bacterium RBG_13_36_22]|uniref:DUF1056 family protein n=1 Tax=Candidatus Woesebacteria bacterium RBG_13_36_22 TaxID=1802478 RepID=A0A1F7X1H4_9BACT|nr:MAG: hypothetical protein A2Z67_02330 [Candidatus Woesebacteria bacterium RBG_13_36_22]
MKELFKNFVNLLFKNGWIVIAMMFLVAITDLIALTSRIHFGAGFVLAFIYFVIFTVFFATKPKDNATNK